MVTEELGLGTLGHFRTVREFFGGGLGDGDRMIPIVGSNVMFHRYLLANIGSNI